MGVSVLARALAFREAISDPAIGNRAGLARRLGVSRAHITQAMAVLEAPAEVRGLARSGPSRADLGACE